MSTWYLGACSPTKMIHREGCRFARRPYEWAGDRTPDELAMALFLAGKLALENNQPCYFCAGDLRLCLRNLVSGYPVRGAY